MLEQNPGVIRPYIVANIGFNSIQYSAHLLIRSALLTGQSSCYEHLASHIGGTRCSNI